MGFRGSYHDIVLDISGLFEKIGFTKKRMNWIYKYENKLHCKKYFASALRKRRYIAYNR